MVNLIQGESQKAAVEELFSIASWLRVVLYMVIYVCGSKKTLIIIRTHSISSQSTAYDPVVLWRYK